MKVGLIMPSGRCRFVAVVEGSGVVWSLNGLWAERPVAGVVKRRPLLLPPTKFVAPRCLIGVAASGSEPSDARGAGLE